MKNKLSIAIFTSLFGISGIGLAAGAVDANALEPCINGAVSASGLYPTQSEEDKALAESKRLEQSRKPQVSASGSAAPNATEERDSGSMNLETTWLEKDPDC